MPPLVQAAIDAVKQGDKNKARELIEQALNANPNDINALLVLATLAGESRHKRQILNRVLSLDATNKVAREMMLDMDRAEINSYRSTDVSALKTQSQVDASDSPQSHLPQKPSKLSLEKPMSFRYPAAWMAILYVFTIFSCCGTLWYATINITFSFPFLALFLAMTLMLGITVLTLSSRVELDEKVIRVSSLIRSVEMNWSEISNLEFDPMRRNLELRSNIGEFATISTQIQGYKTLVELLREKRPDLFAEAIFPTKQVTASQAGSISSAYINDNKTISTPGPNQQPAPASSTSAVPSQPSPFTSQGQTESPPRTASNLAVEKPLTFRYSTGWLIWLYVITMLACLTGLLAASQSFADSLPSFGLALLFGLTALSLSSKTEVTGIGIRTSSLLNSTNMEWKDIASLKSNSIKRRLELVSGNGTSVNISTQVQSYPVFVEMLRQKRPDLFGQATSATTQPEISASENDRVSSAGFSQSVSAFTEARTFQKGFTKQYGILFVLVPAGLLFFWLSTAGPDTRTAFLVTAGACALMSILPFFQVNAIRVEPNKLTIETFFEQKELAARQINDINMQSIRGRYGRITNIVNIIPAEGKKYPLGGFRDGDEMVYGTLMSWWNTYRDK